MKKLLFVAILAAATTALACRGGSTASSPASGAAADAKTKKTEIVFTTNHSEGGQYSTACRAVVSTETIGVQKGDKVEWHLKKQHGQGADDECDSIPSGVNVRFKTANAMGVNKIDATGTVIKGTVSMTAIDGDHGYAVFIGDDPAGPDPIIVVGCSSCGPPPK